MTTLTDRIDRFVRWFFNSSPDRTRIDPRPPARGKPSKAKRHPRSGGAARRSGQRRRVSAARRADGACA